MDFAEAYAATSVQSAWDAALRPAGGRGRKTPKPADLYEGIEDTDAWAGANRFSWETTGD